jgi:hypothetical protein
LTYVGVNPNEAISSGQAVQGQAQSADAMRGRFDGATLAAGQAAAESPLPSGYDAYASLWLDRINKVITLTNQAGQNAQTGGSAAIGTDGTAASGFSQATSLLSGAINRGGSRAF